MHWTVKEVLKDWLKNRLKNRGYDGLAGEDCGCLLADLCPCSDVPWDCMPGYNHKPGEKDFEMWPFKKEDAPRKEPTP